MTEVSVVIPNLNGMQYLPACLASVLAQEGVCFEVILIDNGSQDESVDWVRTHAPQVRIRRFHGNTGFCRAVNEGIGLARAPYVLLLNNDTVCEPGFVRELKEALDRYPDAFSVQAKMLSLAEPTLLDDAGDGYCALGWAYARGKGRAETRYETEEEIFSACAGAAIYRRSALEQVGGFDERHFAYLEDLDIGYRARLAGYRNYFAPRARVRHAGSGASGSRYNAFKIRHSSRNSVYLIYKNMPGWQILLNLPLLLTGFFIKIVFFARRGFGAMYCKGLLQGMRMCRPEDRVDFSAVPLGRLLRMEGRLLAGIADRLREG